MSSSGGSNHNSPGKELVPPSSTAATERGGLRPKIVAVLVIVGLLALVALLSGMKMGYSKDSVTVGYAPSAPSSSDSVENGGGDGGAASTRRKNSNSSSSGGSNAMPNAAGGAGVFSAADADLLNKLAAHAEKQIFRKEVQAGQQHFIQVNNQINWDLPPDTTAAKPKDGNNAAASSPAVVAPQQQQQQRQPPTPAPPVRFDVPLAPPAPIALRTPPAMMESASGSNGSAAAYTLKMLREENARTIVTGMAERGAGATLKLLFEPLGAASAHTAVRRGTAYDEKQRECATPSQAEKGMYWSYRDKECRMMEGFATPMQPFEINTGELSCSDDSLYEAGAAAKGKKGGGALRWQKAGFRDFSNTTGVLDRFKIGKSWLAALREDFEEYKRGGGVAAPPATKSSSDGNATAANGGSPLFSGSEWYAKTAVPVDVVLERRYSRFQFYTSWVFRQWLPWKPRPRLTLARRARALKRGGAAAANTLFKYAAWHDAGTENVYQIRNFCLHPNQGLSGFDPSNAEQWRSFDDTRNKYHGEIEWRNFFKFVRQLPDVPLAFDERPTFFLPLMPLSRVNQAHTSLKFFAALGMLDFPLFGMGANDDVSSWKPSQQQQQQQDDAGGDDDEDEFVAGTGTHHFNRGAKIKPLLVLIWSKTPAHMPVIESDTRKTTAWGLFLRVLDLPYAVVDVRQDEEKYMKLMYALGQHSGGDIPTTAAPGWSPESTSSADQTGAAAGAGRPAAALSAVADSNAGVAKRFVGGAEVCFRRGVVWQACHFACNPGEDGDHEEASWSNFGRTFSKLNVWRLNTIRRYLSLLHNCLPLPRRSYIIGPGALTPDGKSTYVLPFKNAGSGGESAAADKEPLQLPPPNAMAYSPSADLAVPKPNTELPRVFFLLRTSTRGFSNLPVIADRIVEHLRGFVSEVLFREPWRGSRAAFVDEMRTSDVFVFSHGGAGAESVLLRPRPVAVEYQAGMYACGDNAGCWFEPMIQSAGGSHHIYQLGQQPNSFFMLPPWMIADHIKEAVCRWYYQQPHRVMPSERVRLYCAKIAGNTKFKSRHFNNFGPINANFGVDLADVQQVLRDNFAISLADRDAVLLVEKLRKVHAGNREPMEKNLRSEAPHLFRTLFTRFIDAHVTRVGKVNVLTEQRELDGATKRRGVTLPGGKFVALSPIVCLRPDPNSTSAAARAFLAEQQQGEAASPANAPAAPATGAGTGTAATAGGGGDPPAEITKPPATTRKSTRLCLYYSGDPLDESEERERF